MKKSFKELNQRGDKILFIFYLILIDKNNIMFAVAIIIGLAISILGDALYPYDNKNK